MVRGDRDEPIDEQLEVLMARSSLNRPAVQALSSRVSAERASLIQRRAGVITHAAHGALVDDGAAGVTADIGDPMRRMMTTAAVVITDPASTTQDRERHRSSPRGMSHPSEDLEPAVRAAAQGDRVALGMVLEVVRPLIMRYCRARVGGNERGSMSADDVAQEVCLAVMTALPRYQDQGGRSWPSYTESPHTKLPMRIEMLPVTKRTRWPVSRMS